MLLALVASATPRAADAAKGLPDETREQRNETMAEPYATLRVVGRRIACVGRDFDGSNGFNRFASRDGEDPRLVRTRRAVPTGLGHHTDRGSPYARDEYRNALKEYGMTASMNRGSPYARDDYRNAPKEYGMTASMSRAGDRWDYAVSEGFSRCSAPSSSTKRGTLAPNQASALSATPRELVQRRAVPLASRRRQLDRGQSEDALGRDCGIVRPSTKAGGE